MLLGNLSLPDLPSKGRRKGGGGEGRTRKTGEKGEGKEGEGEKNLHFPMLCSGSGVQIQPHAWK